MSDINQVSYMVCGCWKIRHCEPMEGAEHTLRLYQMQFDSLDVVSIYMDARTVRSAKSWEWSGSGDEKTPSEDRTLENLDSQSMPLAILNNNGSEWWVSHLVVRLELEKVLFVKNNFYLRDCSMGKVLEGLVASFDMAHLQHNNFECAYTEWDHTFSTLPLRQLTSDGNYFRLAKQWYTELDDCRLPGLAPQLGCEWEEWDYKEHSYEVDRQRHKSEMYVSVREYSRLKKKFPQEPWITYGSSLSLAGLEATRFSRARNFLVPAGKAISLIDEWGSLRYLNTHEVKSCRVLTEVLSTGNIFVVEFQCGNSEDAWGAHSDRSIVSVGYLKSRVQTNQSSIADDLDCIAALVGRLGVR